MGGLLGSIFMTLSIMDILILEEVILLGIPSIVLIKGLHKLFIK